MFLGLIIGFVFNMLKYFDIYSAITEKQIVNIVNQVLSFPGLEGETDR